MTKCVLIKNLFIWEVMSIDDTQVYITFTVGGVRNWLVW